MMAPLKDLDTFHSEMTFLDQGVTYLGSRAQSPPSSPPPAPLPPFPYPLPTLQPLEKKIFVVFMRVRQFIVLMYLICVYMCANPLLSEISPTIIRDQPLLSEISL